jgi:hypothetical protein
MVVRPIRCDQSRLRSLLDDDLPELEQAELSDHLDTCASCRRTLERLAAGSQLWSELRQLAPGPDCVPRSAPAAGATALFGTSPQGDPNAERNRSLDLKYELSSVSSLKFVGNPATLEGTKTGASSISRAN